MEFKNKNVLITGGSRGIGRATAVAFAMKGANIAISYKSDDFAAKETLSLLKKGNHTLYKRDISEEHGPEELINNFIVVKFYLVKCMIELYLRKFLECVIWMFD